MSLDVVDCFIDVFAEFVRFGDRDHPFHDDGRTGVVGTMCGEGMPLAALIPLNMHT